jgi:hypothetical protein
MESEIWTDNNTFLDKKNRDKILDKISRINATMVSNITKILHWFRRSEGNFILTSNSGNRFDE